MAGAVQPPLKLDWFTKLTKINFPASNNGLVLINADQGGSGKGPQTVTITGLPMSGGQPIDFGQNTKLILRAPSASSAIPIVARPSKGMLANLYGWSTLWQYSQNAPPVNNPAAPLPPIFSQQSFFILNVGKVVKDFPAWDRQFTVTTSIMEGAPANPNNNITLYIVFQIVNGVFDPFAVVDGSPNRWFMEFGNYPNYPVTPTYQTVFQRYLKAITGSGGQVGAAGFAFGSIPVVRGDGTLALQASDYFAANDPIGDAFGVFSWEIANPTQGIEADAQIVAGLYGPKSMQTFNQGYLQGSDTSFWYSPPPGTKGVPPDQWNHANIPPNGPLSTVIGTIFSEFGSLPTKTRTFMISKDLTTLTATNE